MQPYLLSAVLKTGWDSCQCCSLTQASMLTILSVRITLLCVHLSHLSCLHLRQHGTCYWHALSGLLLVVWYCWWYGYQLPGIDFKIQ